MPAEREFSPEAVGRTILAADSDAIVASGADGLIQFWNPGAERIFGYNVAEAVGRSLDLIIPERLRARHWEGYDRVTAGAPSRYSSGDLLAVPAIRKDGSQLSVEFTIAPIRSASSSIVGLVAVMRDVTAKFEEVKELRRKLRAVAQPT